MVGIKLSRKQVLTDEQKAIIEANITLFPADIKKLPGLAEDDRVTRPIIANYLKKARESAEPDDIVELRDCLEKYMSVHGLPSRFHGRNNVTGFLEFLRQ